MPSFITNALLPLVIGPLAFVVMQGLKSLSVTVDALPPTAKRIAVMVIAIALTALGTLAGVDFQCNADAGVNCLSHVDQDAVKAVIGTVLAYAMHYAKGKKG